jgi:hypothetical protein
VYRCGWPWRSAPTGAGCWRGRTAPGTRPCACSASAGRTTGTRSSSALAPQPHTAPPRNAVRVPLAPGDLIDKITILEIKAERIADPAKLHNVRLELAALTQIRDRELPQAAGLADLTAGLRAVNGALWEIEDDIRLCERGRDFGPRFIELARSVYQTNDRRAALKRQINELLGSDLFEEKAYARYDGAAES